MTKPTERIIEKITIELRSDDYNPIDIVYKDGSKSYQGGGNIDCAVIGLLAEVKGDNYMSDKWDRLSDEDRTHIARRIDKAFNNCKEDVEYYLKNFYD